MSFSLEGYFNRIGYQGSTAPTLDTLCQLHLAHTCAIPFENLDALMNMIPRLDDDSVYEKLVVARRGGWCFEQNALFSRVLYELGFAARNLTGRVLLANPPSMPARTHRLIMVSVHQESWIADVGFGGKTTPLPLRLVPEALQQTQHGLYSFSYQNGVWHLRLHDGVQIQSLYCFTLEQQYNSDFEMANYYVATWPESHFRYALTLSLFLPDGGRTTLYSHGSEACSLEDPVRLYTHLQQEFHLGFDHPLYGISQARFTRIVERLGNVRERLQNSIENSDLKQ